MKRLVRMAACAALALAPAAGTAAGGKLDPVPVGGKAVARAIAPTELEGLYRYEKKGEPVIRLNADGTGEFQAHMVPSIPIRYWVEADDGGAPKKQLGNGNPNYGYVLVVEYGPGGGGNYPAGSYDAWQWVMNVETGCAIILGERFRC